MNKQIFSQTFPELTEREHDLLELSHTIRWLEGQVELYSDLGRDVIAFAHQLRLDDVRVEYKKLEESK